MTSGVFTRIPIDSVIVIREGRQRRELKDIDDLADSLRRVGQINPITITRENVLVAGERRLASAKQLGWTHISAQFEDALDQNDLYLIELEENVRRAALDWKDECAAVKLYHERRCAEDPSWTVLRTTEALGFKDDRSIYDRLQVQQLVEENHPLVMNADKLSVATNILVRKKEREKHAVVAAILDEPTSNDSIPLYNATIEEWLLTYDGPAFNFLHCDFPYGTNFDKQNGQNSANLERYDDSFETYQHLLEEVLPSIPLAPSAHLMFWFSMLHYPYTALELQKQGWKVQPFPLIWCKSDNSGLLPDPKRGPRRNYETAFIATKGDRPIVQAVSNFYHGPSAVTHASAKPRPMLSHFFRMFVDSSTVMLDPTCGSGNAVLEAKQHGAARVAGVERSEVFHGDAVRWWKEALHIGDPAPGTH
ncbi:MAG TPA: ParB N-terminal domain-containing protein [Gemmatimonadales bacterium]|nr:ParB N-terminal domain-containing protein [Gemmatimonadales bacterium]